MNTIFGHSPDDRDPLARAVEWTSRVTTISFEMVLPGMVGFWIDQRLGTKAIFLVLGVVLGFATGLWHLIRLGKSSPPGGKPTQTTPEKEP